MRKSLTKGCLTLLAGLTILWVSGCRQDPVDHGTPDATGVYRQLARPSQGGTGKVYMGREIAAVLGHPAADWMDRPSRDAQELPDRVIEALELKPGAVVADIGAGTGYFTLRISPRVPAGMVYAVDIEQEMLDMIRRKVAEKKLENVRTVLSTVQNPSLPDSSIDVALMVDAYHEFSHPREMMLNLVKALKPGGRVVLVEYRGEDETLPIDRLHRMTEAQVRKEVRAVGLEWLGTRDFLPQQHLMVFARPEE